jgi:hypothetical protein
MLPATWVDGAKRDRMEKDHAVAIGRAEIRELAQSVQGVSSVGGSSR